MTLILFHLYMQASWYGWWLGTNTFGQRGLAIAAVLLVPPLVGVISESAETSPVTSRTWVALTVAACVWSFPILCQELTQFYTYSDLMQGFKDNLGMPFLNQKIAPLLVGIGIYFTIFFLRRRHQDKKESEIVITGAGVFLGVLCLSYLLLLFVTVLVDKGALSGRMNRATLLTVQGTETILVFICCFLLNKVFTGTSELNGLANLRFRSQTAGVVTIIFVLIQLLFLNLALRTESKIAQGIRPAKMFLFQADFQIDEVINTYREYHLVEGFEDKKRALGKFLMEQEIRSKHSRR